MVYERFQLKCIVSVISTMPIKIEVYYLANLV